MPALPSASWYSWPVYLRSFRIQLQAFEELKLFARLPTPDNADVPRALPEPLPVAEQQVVLSRAHAFADEPSPRGTRLTIPEPLPEPEPEPEPLPPLPPMLELPLPSPLSPGLRTRAKVVDLKGRYADLAAVAAAVGISLDALTELVQHADPFLKSCLRRLVR